MVDETPFHGMAELQDKIFLYHFKPRGFNNLETFLKKNSNEPILEIGCGNGLILEMISNYFSDLHGIDESENMIERAKIKFGTNNFSAKIIGEEYIDFSKYNTIIGMHGICQLLSPKQKDNLFENLKKTMKKEAKFIFGCRGFNEKPYYSDYIRNNEDPSYTYNEYPFTLIDNEYYKSIMINHTWINEHTEWWDYINIDKETKHETRMRHFKYRCHPRDLIEKAEFNGLKLCEWLSPLDSGFYEHLLTFKRN